MRLWDKGTAPNADIEQFTIGEDSWLDVKLWKHDLDASLAHARMLCAIGLLRETETADIATSLEELKQMSEGDVLALLSTCEDGHTAIETFLTSRLGETGRKIHTGRSRNDQVLTALRLYEKEGIGALRKSLETFQQSLAGVIERSGTIALPGYTHMRKAMPSTVAQWLGCFRDAALDDDFLLQSLAVLIDQSPLGTAAGYGVPVLPLDRKMTADLMNFARVQENPVYAQLSRGKFEALILDACSTILLDVNKLASDLMLFQTSEFGYIELPHAFCTGSSIMPQKKNPDVLELLRAQYHVVNGEAFKVKGLIANLISGYNRDLQLTKGPLIRGLEATLDALRIISLVLDNLKICESACTNALTPECYATEQAYNQVMQGVPFRDAYRNVAKSLITSTPSTG